MSEGYAAIGRRVTEPGVEQGAGLDGDGGIVYNRRFQIGVPLFCAEVAELADAQASGACGRKVVEVQILSSASHLKSMFYGEHARRDVPILYLGR
jgi:hypothetical protein